MAELFIELVSEEIPPSQQEPAADNLARLLCELLEKEGLSAKIREKFSTPLRFGACLDDVPSVRPASTEERRGPSVKAPEKAMEGFKRGLPEETALRQVGDHYFADIKKPEIKTIDFLAAQLPELLRTFPWAKSMRWIEGSNFRWVRPLTSVTCLLDDELVKFEVAKIHTSNKNKIESFDDYKKKMEADSILINPRDRETKIEKEMNVTFVQFKEYGINPLFDAKNLIQQMARVAEKPELILGDVLSSENYSPPKTALDKLLDFMEIKEAQQSLFHKELCLPIAWKSFWGGNFLYLIEQNDEAKENAEKGIVKTLDARLADLNFFLTEDSKKSLNKGREELKGMLFHQKLGSMLKKAERIKKSCENYDEETKTAALYCKADIPSMVGKAFPEALGRIGSSLFFFQNKKLEKEKKDRVKKAIATHYLPKNAGDDLPSPEGQLIGLADRADTLAGFFSIGEVPSGSKDPYALRRSAIGMIRILLDGKGNEKAFATLDLNNLFTRALSLYTQRDTTQDAATLKKLRTFMAERLKYHLRGNFAPDLVDAAIMDDHLCLKLIQARVGALHNLIQSDDGKSLMAAWKRISGILKNAPKDLPPLDDAALTEPAEEALAAQLANTAYPTALAALDFKTAFAALAGLRPLLDNFFESVRVQTDDTALTQNRLALCAKVRAHMLEAADFSKI